jgi:hypothetical protein
VVALDYGDHHDAIRLDEVINRQVAPWNECVAVVVELDREYLGIESNSICGRKVAVEKRVAPADNSFCKVVVGRLNVVADKIDARRNPRVIRALVRGRR